MRIHDSTSCMYLSSCASSMFHPHGSIPYLSYQHVFMCQLQPPGSRLPDPVRRRSVSGQRLLARQERQRAADDGAAGDQRRARHPSGPPLAHDGTVVACGIHLAKGFDRASGGRGLCRPGDILIGHRAPGADQFSWSRIAAGWCSPCGDRPCAATTGGAACCSQTTAAARSATGRSATSRIRRSARTREVTPVSTTVGERASDPAPSRR